MEILDLLRRRKLDAQVKPLGDDVYTNKYADRLIAESYTFFPTSGEWYSNCYGRANTVCEENLPCHLRDHAWMSRLMQKNLQKKGVNIPQETIERFMDASPEFAALRHNYELRIVKWQINWIVTGGDNWLMPKGTDEFSFLFSADVDKIVRAGVVKTLTAIGMDSEVIEEGLERNADIWRRASMRAGFRNKFEPVRYSLEPLDPPETGHLENWIAAREYEYYQDHQAAVDRYGEKTQAMKMTKAENFYLTQTLNTQNFKRLTQIAKWERDLCLKAKHRIDERVPQQRREEELDIRIIGK